MRKDVVDALKEIGIPNLRWPGGCFADQYHWRDGIGPAETRHTTINTNWGGVVETNRFGTHEFLDLCSQLGCEPVIAGNLGSGTVEEMSSWVEYRNAGLHSSLADLRRANGRDKPWDVRFWDIGNEAWGCGGNMSAEYYSEQLRRTGWFLHAYGDTVLYKIASGGLPEDFHWTEVIMRQWSETQGWLQGYMNGYSLHYYTVCQDWSHKGSATAFDENGWFSTLSKTLTMEDLIEKHGAIMDRYDPQKHIGLVVDEWGNWHDPEPGTNPAFLYQQNTLRDAITAAVNLDIFNRHCDRVAMANLAQVVNVLQAELLTRGDSLVRTPTFYVFAMYRVHHDAKFIPARQEFAPYTYEGHSIPSISSSASLDSSNRIHLTLSNLNPSVDQRVRCVIRRAAPVVFRKGIILSAGAMNAYNSFGDPEHVRTADFRGVEVHNDTLDIHMPPKSVVMLELQ